MTDLTALADVRVGAVDADRTDAGAVSTFAEYLAKYRPDEFERDRLAAMTPEERTRDGLQRAIRDLHCRHCGALPDADGDHSCPCPYRDGECPDHA